MRFLIPFLAALLLAIPALADNDLDCQVVAEAINPTEAQATDDYVNLTDGTFGTTAAAEDEFIVARDIKVWGLRADVDVAPSANDEWQIVVVDDGAETLVQCAITGTNTSCVADPMTVATVAAGSDLTVLIDGDAGAANPDAAAELRFAFCMSRGDR